MKIKRKNSPIKIFLADDHTLFREGLKRILETEKGIKVVGETENGRQTLDQLLDPRAAPAPDIVLLDINLPDISGIKITHSVKQKHKNHHSFNVRGRISYSSGF
ncbi:MAG: response regulator transcription factor [Proteobacteria bacterium]|nr:response regulator transcription factor [Pseudomonadota bacterium]MBU4056266.1 response regulator transcription factor [Pseudomonadota bacterium]